MFQETIIQLNNGATVAECSDKLRDLVQKVRATAKGGSLTLTLKINPAAKGDVDVLMIESVVKVSAPEPDRRKNVFFSTEEGALSRNDPKQMDLPLRPRVIEVSAREVSNG